MDTKTQIRLTRELIDIDSTTGREGDAGRFIATMLRELGYDVSEQPVADGRFNVMALGDKPRVVLSTHLDCVPPFFPSRESSGRIHGRGACDAKGALVAQIAAAERLRARGERRVGLLFVVGEERGSDGARAANATPPGSAFLIDGEPTDNRLGVATRGVYRARLTAAGRAAHSSQPALGESAIDKLLDALLRVREIAWPHDPLLGRTFYSVGLIRGGIAPNVIPPDAEAELMFRTVGAHSEIRERLESAVGDLVRVTGVAIVPPVRLRTLPGPETAVFSFTTDIPLLDRWGVPLLVGPGSVRVAHTDDEYVDVDDLVQAVNLYADLAARLLAEAAALPSHSG